MYEMPTIQTSGLPSRVNECIGDLSLIGETNRLRQNRLLIPMTLHIYLSPYLRFDWKLETTAGA